MKKIYFVLSLFSAFFFSDPLLAQVSVTATAGTAGPTVYGTLKDAFDAINTGTHQGSITIDVTGTTETAPAVLNSSGAGSALYTAILIRPAGDNTTISGSPATGRGIIELNGADNVTIDGDNPNSAGINKDLTIQNTSAGTTTFTSCIRIALSTLVVSADNNIVKNCILKGNAAGRNVGGVTAEVVSWAVIVSGGASTVAATTAPGALASATTTITTGTTVSSFQVLNNTIETVSRGVSINGAATTVAPGLVISNNTIGNATQGDANQVTQIGITVQGSANAIISANTIRVESYSITTNATRAIDIGLVNAAVSGCVVEKNIIERCVNNHPDGYGSYGINISAGNNHEIRNNFVMNVRNTKSSSSSSFSTTYGSFGIRLGSGTGHKIYHNSVHLSGTIPGAATGNLNASFCIVATSQTGCDVRNNIFSNLVTGSNPGTRAVAIYLPSAATSAMNLTWNNNAYFTGNDVINKLAQAGATYGTGEYPFSDFLPSAITPATNLRAYTSTLSAAGTNDNASFAVSAVSPFLSNTDLHIDNTVSATSQLESGGAAVGINSDIDGNVRPGPAGSINGGAVAVDIGADEFDGFPLDVVPPSISLTGLASTCTLGDRTLTNVVITDISGVPTAGTLRPRIYYQKNGGAWFSQPGTLSSGTATNGNWSFTIVATDMGGVAVNDEISYFIVAQDIAATPNKATYPAGGDATDVNNINTYPPSPLHFLIGGLLNGTYTIGSGGAYTTLTGAINAYNAACPTGPVVFSLIDADYSGSETFPLTINTNSYASAVNTLTIKPAAANTITISGSATAIIKLNGADYVTIDGSNNGSQSRDITISNSLNTASSVIWIASNAGGNGATNNTIKNLVVIGGSVTATGVYGIVSSLSTGLGNPAEDNDFLTIQNDSISNAYIGISALNASGAGLGAANLIIRSNSVGNNAGTTNSIGFIGIQVSYSPGALISQNGVYNVRTSAGITNMGIDIGDGVTNASVTRNFVSGIYNSNAVGYGAYGINVSGTATSDILVANNMITDIKSVSYMSSSPGIWSAYGIRLNGGTNIKVYNNSVYLFDAPPTNARGNSANLVVTAAVTNLDVRNNVFVNSTTFGTAPSTAWNVQLIVAQPGAVFDYNDYYGATSSNTVYAVGYDGTGNRLLLSDWQSFTLMDAGSKSLDPEFFAPNDLHISNTSPVNNQGLALASVIIDFDGEARDPGAPDIGADEIVAPACSGAVGGTASAVNNLLCVSGSTSITTTGFSSGSGSGYQWQSSPNNSTWTNISGQTVPGSLNTGTITSTTYYRLRVTCVAGVGTDYSNVVTVAVNPNPTMTVSPAGPVTICQPATQNLSITATSAASPSYQWMRGGMDLAGEVTANYTVTQSGSYTVKVTDGVTSCFLVSPAVVVTINPQPDVVVITPSSLTVCPGSPAQQLTASGGTLIGASILNEDFNGTAPGWTNINNTTGGTPSATAWSATPSNATYASNDNTQFYRTSSEAGGSGNTTATILQSPAFSTIGFNAANLSFYHYYRDWDVTDFARVEISTDGTNWNNLATYTTNQGAPLAFANVTIDLSAYLGQPTVYIRFKYDAEWSWYWMIDNVSITGDQVTNITWAPATGLFTDAAATVPYTGGVTTSVYAKPAGTTIYTATATSVSSCTNTTNITATYSSVISNATALAASAGTQSCNTYDVALSNNYFNDCRLIATVVPNGGAAVSGNVNACVKIETGLPTAANGQPYVARHYDILPATNATTATSIITLYFTPAEFSAYNAGNGAFPDLPTGAGDATGIANLRVTQFNSTTSGGLTGYTAGSGSQINPVDGDIVFNAAANRWSVTFNATGSGGFYVHTGNFVLPVTSLEFNGERAGTINRLTWKTATEINNKGFELQRSVDGINFSSIAFIASKADGGNSASPLNYVYNDEKPIAGNNYYRLKQVDRDGKFTYSKIVLLTRKVSGILITSLYPNPTIEELNLVIMSPSAEKATIIITDLTGNVIMQQATQLVIGENQDKLNIHRLPAGTYLIKAVCINGCETSVQRFVKQ